MRNDSDRKQHKGNHSNNKEAYTDGLKSTRRKVKFAEIFADIIRSGALPEEASIHIAEMIAMKEIQKREDMRWVINTELLSSMVPFENNRAQLHNQGKQITLCKVHVHIVIKGNEEAQNKQYICPHWMDSRKNTISRMTKGHY